MHIQARILFEHFDEEIHSELRYVFSNEWPISNHNIVKSGKMINFVQFLWKEHSCISQSYNFFATCLPISGKLSDRSIWTILVPLHSS